MREREPDDLNAALPNEEARGQDPQPSDDGWTKVPDELNIWQPKKVGEKKQGVVTAVTHEGKYGLQVKIMEPDGSIIMLPSHKYLQSRLEGVRGGLHPHKTSLRVTFMGTESSEDGRNPSQLYEVEYRQQKGVSNA